ncbi:uncharacterized protein LOC118436939 isoform X1 [Folsomia candida]|uniref:uncharacterized protein LOC118436939 isoform X1 n=1 Tax=Folsomia candida TaxID=158441 RepID=UPI001604EBA5|nr:uncharacterized protein LOC118436939 isoform X1 [Folsomia candida]
MPDAKETEDDHVEDTLAEHQVLYNHQCTTDGRRTARRAVRPGEYLSMSLHRRYGAGYQSRPEDPDNYETLMKEHYEQRNDPEIGQGLVSSFQITPSVGPLVVELRLEIMLRDEADAKLLGGVLCHMQNLRRFCFDIVNFTDEGVQSVSKGDIPSGITTLGLRVHRVDDGDGVKSLQSASYAYLIQLFPSLQFLDFEGWFGLFMVDEDLTKESKCLTAPSPPKGAHPCPNLQGIRADYLVTEEMVRAFAAFPRPLKFLLVRIYQKNDDTVRQVGQMLRHHSESANL